MEILLKLTTLEMILIWTNLTMACLWGGTELERYLDRKKARGNVPKGKENTLDFNCNIRAEKNIGGN